MSVDIIKRLQDALAKVQGGELPKDIAAMAKLNDLLCKASIYTSGDGRRVPLFGAETSAAITATIAEMIDGRFERILKVLEEASPP